MPIELIVGSYLRADLQAKVKLFSDSYVVVPPELQMVADCRITTSPDKTMDVTTVLLRPAEVEGRIWEINHVPGTPHGNWTQMTERWSILDINGTNYFIERWNTCSKYQRKYMSLFEK